MTKSIAFIATGYIPKYDGISVYTENLLLQFLKLVKNDNEIKIDIYIGLSVLELLEKRIFQEKLLTDNINIITVNDKSTIYKLIHLNLKLITKIKYDMIFMTNFMPTMFLLPKTVKVIHDFSVNNFPELYSKNYLKYHNFLLWYAKKFDHAIGYISNTTLEDLNIFHGINHSNKKLLYCQNGIPFKVKNHERPTEEFGLNKYNTKDLELLVVGRINRHKGFDRILDFCKYFDTSNEISNFNNVRLNIVGKQTDETTQIFKNLKLKNIELKFHGFLYDDELNSLYKTSHFCLFLSRNEGYGIPLVEALWFRTIPIISNIPIFSEIMSEEYPKFDDNTNYTSSIVTFIDKIFKDNTYLKEHKEFLEFIVSKEKDGYEIAAKNLLNFIKEL